jgi:RNA polymerase sigma factor (sigma-70 family)
VPTVPLRTLLDRLRRTVGESGARGADDARLLGRWVALRDEAAFELLVYRHGPAVLGVCQRLLTNRDDVEDCFQAAFIALVRKAGTIARREAVGAWLYQVARRAALRVRAEAARRAGRERPFDETLTTGDAMGGCEYEGVLDEEIARLPRKYREAVVLCWLGGRSVAEAARELGCPVGTLSARLTRARQRLRRRLARRGMGIAAVVGAVAEEPVAGVPPPLARSALGMALGYNGGGSGSASAARAAALAEGVLRAMSWTKLKAAITVVLAASLLMVGTAAILPRTSAEEQPKTSTEGIAAKPAAAREIRVIVLDPGGKPVANASIHASIWTTETGFKSNRDYSTDEKGTVNVQLPGSMSIVRLWAKKRPFVTLFANWEQNELAGDKELPPEYVFRMEPGISAGGRVVDEQGQSIAGAKVQVTLGQEVKPARGDGRVKYERWLAHDLTAVRTDAEGRWSISNVPDHPGVELDLLLSHPDFTSDEVWRQTRRSTSDMMKSLRQQAAVLTLKPGHEP